MSNHRRIRPIDMSFIDSLFEMGGGYVLDFSNQTFAEFFIDELSIDIDDPRYSVDGSSKAKRLRYLLRTSDSALVVKILLALWEYREANRRRSGIKEQNPDVEIEFCLLIERLGGTPPRRPKVPPVGEPSTYDASDSARLKDQLIGVSELEPQARGYAFEKFLRDLFDANALTPRASFKLAGEQIDGSFDLSAEIYLLEAKWTSAQVGAADLRSFNAKVEDKAAWSRGIFISHSGFSEEGLEAFGRGKRVVCMDGLDLFDMLDRNLSLADVVARKVRRAAESGTPFVRVRDLFPCSP